MQLKISHTTRYEYDCPVLLHPHLLYLRPRENPLLKVKSFAFTFTPNATISWMRDDFDNLPASALFTDLSSVLEIRSDCQVTTTDLPPFDFMVRDYANNFPFDYEPLHRFNLGIYLTHPTKPDIAPIASWLKTHFTDRPKDTVSWLFALNKCIHLNIAYTRRDEPGIQTATETLRLGSGSCRDFSVLFIACARSLGLAARFVSGYLFDPGNNASLPGDMHAWAEVFLPGAGWRGLDPTSGIFCDNAYVPVAHAVVAESVNPIQGSYYSSSPVQSTLTSDVRVQRLAAPQ